MPSSPSAIVSHTPPTPAAPAAVASHTPPSPASPAAVSSYSAPSASAPSGLVTPPVPTGPLVEGMQLNGSAIIEGEAAEGNYIPEGTSQGKPIYVQGGGPDFRKRIIAALDTTQTPNVVRWRLEADASGSQNNGSWSAAFVGGEALVDYPTPDLEMTWTRVTGGVLETAGSVETITPVQVALPFRGPDPIIT